MEMEAECLLDTEMLDEDQTNETSDEVSRILLEGGEEVSGGSSCIPSAMDFEFTNSDLGSTSDFSIDHSSMFDIPESVIDEKGDCGYLFKDTSIFEDVHVKQSGDIDNLGTVSCANKKTSVNDLGLRLQIIPLNNLQFVSTIQTSEGLHILAVPAGSNLNVMPQISSLIAASQTDSIVPHTANSVNFSLNESPQNLPCPLPTVVSQRTAPEIVPSVQNISISNISVSETPLQSAHNEDFTESADTTETQPVNFLVSQDLISSPSDILQVKKKPVVLSSKAHKRVTSHQTKMAMSSALNKIKSNDGRKSHTHKNKVCKESKIVIDLRKLAQTRKKQMVSLLNNPKTKSLLHLHSQKLKTENEKGLKGAKSQQVKDTTITDAKTKTNVSEVNAKPATLLKQIDDSKANKNLTIVKKKETATPKTSGKSAEKKAGRSVKQSAVSEGKINRTSEAPSSRRSFTCPVCFSKFNREGNYKNHLLLHDNSKIDNLPNELMTAEANETENQHSEGIEQEDIAEAPDRQAEQDLADSVAAGDPEETTAESVAAGDPEETTAEDVAAGDPAETTAEDVAAINPDDTTEQFRCQLCSMMFSTEGNLTRHKLTHTVLSKSEVRFRCEVCMRSFLQKCDLKRHQLTHTGQYPYKCSICNKGFIRRSDLTVHERFHLKEKNFRCDLCSKSYYQSGDLHRHIRKSHSNQCEYTCTQCDRRYSTQKSLNQHLTKHLRQRN